MCVCVAYYYRLFEFRLRSTLSSKEARPRGKEKDGRGEKCARCCAHSPTDFCSTERDRSSVITRTPRLFHTFHRFL